METCPGSGVRCEVRDDCWSEGGVLEDGWLGEPEGSVTVGMRCRGTVAAFSVTKFELEQVLAGLVVCVAASGRLAADGRLEHFPNFPGRQLSQDCFAFTQAQPLQEPVLLHLQHAILTRQFQLK